VATGEAGGAKVDRQARILDAALDRRDWGLTALVAATHGDAGLRPARAPVLVRAVESAATGWETGDPGFDPTVGSSMADARANQLGADVGLSEREVEILTLIAQGVPNQEIASRLFLSINSVKTYVRTAYRKIDVMSRAEALGWAIRHGFVSQT
jgi:DNA-binding NarL/FixJ family response regulator